jgi:hypothetical protein
MEALKSANLALRFILELLAVVALGFWGFTSGLGTAMRWVLGLGIPIAAIVLWALFVAPQATVQAPPGVRVAIEVVILAGAALALVATGHPALGLTYVVVVVANRILMVAWNQ